MKQSFSRQMALTAALSVATAFTTTPAQGASRPNPGIVRLRHQALTARPWTLQSAFLAASRLASVSPHRLVSAENPPALIITDDWNQIARYASLQRSLGKKVLVATDIDNTTVVQTQTLGNEQWLDDLFNDLKPLKATRPDLYKARAHRLLVVFHQVMATSSGRPIQDGLGGMFSTLQAAGVQTIALTARSGYIAAVTKRHLAEAGIDMARATLTPNVDGEPSNDVDWVSFQDGLLMVAGGDKGPNLVKLFKKLGQRPDVVIFVDDKERHLRSVQDSMAAEAISAQMFQMTREYAQSKKYGDRERAITRIQLKRLLERGELLNDEQALAQIDQGPTREEIEILLYGR